MKRIGARSFVLSVEAAIDLYPHDEADLLRDYSIMYTKDPNLKYTITHKYRDVVSLMWKYVITFEEEDYFYLCLKHPELIND